VPIQKTYTYLNKIKNVGRYNCTYKYIIHNNVQVQVSSEYCAPYLHKFQKTAIIVGGSFILRCELNEDVILACLLIDMRDIVTVFPKIHGFVCS
jgi:hypothetical protein